MKRHLITSVLATIALTVTGCASSGGAASNPLTQPATTSSSAGSTPPSTQASVYTSQPNSDISAMVSAFNKKYPDIKVDVFRSGTEEVVSKIEAEAKAGAANADVAFIADALTMEKLKSVNLLQKYSSPDAKGIDAKYMDPQGFYQGTKVIATGIAINTDKVKTDPTTWKALTDPAVKGQAVMPSPLYSGAAAYNVALFADNPALGWSYWNDLAANGMRVLKGNGGVLTEVANGTASYGMVVEFIVARAAAKGSPVKFIYPSDGVPVITEPIAIMKDAKHADAAKKFVDFVFSADGQDVGSKLGYVPVKPGAPVPNGLKGVDQLNVMAADVAKLSAQIDNAKAQFKTTFKQ